jgi:hypothetical protein
LAVRVCMTATSDWEAPTTGAMSWAARSSASSQVGRGESSSGLKCPCTPWVAQVARYCWMRVWVRLGWRPSEFPHR